jgi:pimeloyl-ACP methyl ester carboxylesterase
MKEIELSAGTIEYQDTGGDGPVLVLLHGLMMNASLWDEVIAGLSPGYRCVAPTLPLGAHRHAMDPGANLSLPGIARLTAEFLDRLDLRDVTLVGNDTGGALVQLLMGDGNARVGRAVLVSCDAFDNFPPGLTGRTLLLSGKLPPPLFGVFMQQMRLRAVRRLPIAFGWLTKRGDAATARWMRPILTRPDIRRDAVRMLRAAAADTSFLLAAAERLPGFDRPVLVVWASQDRVMPPEHGPRLAGLLPLGRLAEVDDSYTLVPLDQPARLAQIIRDFGAEGDQQETGRHDMQAGGPEQIFRNLCRSHVAGTTWGQDVPGRWQRACDHEVHPDRRFAGLYAHGGAPGRGGRGRAGRQSAPSAGTRS